MPCRTWNDDEIAAIELKKKHEILKVEADRVTKLLCAICTEAEERGIIVDICGRISGLRAWWEEHKEFDRQRIAAEKAAAEAAEAERIRKLTEEERAKASRAKSAENMRRRNILMASARDKLTAEELEALGIK